MSAPAAPRRSARLAAKAAAAAAPPTPAPAAAGGGGAAAAPKKSAKKPAAVRMTPQERYAYLVATDPAWAALAARRQAGRELRAAYLAGDRSTPDLLAIQEVVDGVADLKAKITAAATVEEFQACYDMADEGLYRKAEALDNVWVDEVGMIFLTDTRTWCKEAIAWIQWALGDPWAAAAYAAALAREEAGDYDGPSSYYLGLATMSSESLEEARRWALRALKYFEEGMF